MRAGTMRDLLTLLRNSPSDDDRWGFANAANWQSFGTAWANVVPLTGTQAGNETFDSQGVQSETCYTVTMRYRSDVDSTCRLQYRGQTLEIVSAADPDGRQRTLVLQTRQYAGVA